MRKIVIAFLIGMIFVSGCSVNNSFVCKTRVTDKIADSKGEQLKNRSIVIIQDFTYTYYRLPDYISKSMTEAFIANGYSVVERSNIESIFTEQKMALSGAVKTNETTDVDNNARTKVLDKITIAKIGELTGANTILMVFAVPAGEERIKNLNLRMVDVSTAEIIFTLNLTNEGVGGIKYIFINPLIECVLSEHKNGAKTIYIKNIETSTTAEALVYLNCIIDGKPKKISLEEYLTGVKK